MKNKVSHLITAGAMLFIGAANVRAQVYLNGDAGAAFLQNATLRNDAGKKASFDTGVRGDISVGYNISDCFAAELETGAIWNKMDTIGGKSVSSDGRSINLYQVPFLANLIYKTSVWNGFSGYIGGGAGGEAAILSVGGADNSGSDCDFTFAYQGLAGVKYAICKNMDIGVGYKFLGTLDHHWTIAGSSDSTEGLFTHTVLASFTLRF